MRGRLTAACITAVALALGAATEAAAAGTTRATWSPISYVEAGSQPGYDSVYGVSCPSTQMCMAVDEAGNALAWRNGRWSAPQPVGAGGTLDSVSCPSTSFCVATSSGQATVYDGRDWSMARTVGASATYRISCPTTTFCAAVGATGYPGQPSIVATFNGSTWTSSATPSTGTLQDRLLGVSCPQAGRCTALNHDGRILTLTSGRWVPQRRAIEPGGSSVACPTVSFCMAVGTFSRGGSRNSAPSIPAWYATEVDGHWSAARPVPGLEASIFLSVSCPTANQCMVVGLNGRATLWNKGAWTAPATVFPGRDSATVDVSCPSPNWCMAVNSRGEASEFG